MRTLLTILLLTLGTILKAQSTIDSLVLTKEQNENWILKLEKEAPKYRQLELIRRRILLDTNIYVNQYFADRLKIDNDKLRGTRTEAYGRPLLVFNQLYAADIGNGTRSESIMELSELLTDDRIKSISILKGNQAAAIYGTRANNGVILLTTKNKRTLEEIKKIKLH
jgi:TonB-dependent SusC/RagA subfamily outer membrane receptor